jgi:hypothetical protein
MVQCSSRSDRQMLPVPPRDDIRPGRNSPRMDHQGLSYAGCPPRQSALTCTSHELCEVRSATFANFSYAYEITACDPSLETYDRPTSTSANADILFCRQLTCAHEVSGVDWGLSTCDTLAITSAIARILFWRRYVDWDSFEGAVHRPGE